MGTEHSRSSNKGVPSPQGNPAAAATTADGEHSPLAAVLAFPFRSGHSYLDVKVRIARAGLVMKRVGRALQLIVVSRTTQPFAKSQPDF